MQLYCSHLTQMLTISLYLLALIAIVDARRGYIICFMGLCLKILQPFQSYSSYSVQRLGIPGGKKVLLCQFSEACYRAMNTMPLQIVKENMTFTQTITFDRNDVILLCLLERHAGKGVFCFLVGCLLCFSLSHAGSSK